MMRGKEMTSLVRSASFRTEVKNVVAMFARKRARKKKASIWKSSMER